MQKHGTQQRASGDPYFSHPLEVAGILTDLQARRSRPSPRRSCTTRSRIPTPPAPRSTQLFGEEIGKLVEGLTKISKLDLVSKEARRRENLRKLLLAISATSGCSWSSSPTGCTTCAPCSYMPEEKRARIAEETLDIYAPLAGAHGHARTCARSWRTCLPDLNPEAYDTIVHRLAALRAKKRAAESASSAT